MATMLAKLLFLALPLLNMVYATTYTPNRHLIIGGEPNGIFAYMYNSGSLLELASSGTITNPIGLNTWVVNRNATTMASLGIVNVAPSTTYLDSAMYPRSLALWSNDSSTKPPMGIWSLQSVATQLGEFIVLQSLLIYHWGPSFPRSGLVLPAGCVLRFLCSVLVSSPDAHRLVLKTTGDLCGALRRREWNYKSTLGNK